MSATVPVDNFQVYIISLVQDHLILPANAVLEVRVLEDMHRLEAGPEWMPGSLLWREMKLPVVSLDVLMGQPLPEMSRRSRVLVINSFGTSLPSGLFALISQSVPHLTTIARNTLAPEELKPTDDPGLVQSRARIANTECFIPNLENLEVRISEYLGDLI